ncbi:NUMOD4 domain-containing protein [Paenibacillus sp. D9]|uniref:NUMOD4 domain-containing protein n=1 Tax=Paenibacillus sp. D9 TaxID=665792 RepID=UPI000B148C0C|nr:NUMOD4 domain-containing protein [Paenibacillus sp. D9]
MIETFLHGKSKADFKGKTPPEIHQECVEALGAEVNKKALKKAIFETFGLTIKVCKVDGIAKKVYYSPAARSIEDLPREQWRDVAGYEGLYVVSNFGRIKSVNKLECDGEKLLAQTVLNNGYLKVSLSRNGIIVNGLVHRVVAGAFISNSNNLEQVDHWDMDKTNNNVWNLRWVTADHNKYYAKQLKPLLQKECNRKVLTEIHRRNTEGVV